MNMMKYRGPKDQHTFIERKYMIRLLVGLAIVAAGAIATLLGVALSQTTISAPNPVDPGAGPMEVKSPVRPNPAIGTIALIVGTLVDLYAISKYRSEYAEIREKEPRPERVFVGIGLLIILLAIAVGGYTIFVIGPLFVASG